MDGSGRGWASRFEDQSLPEAQAKRMWLVLLIVMVLSFFVLAVSNSPEFPGSLFRVSLGLLATLCEFVLTVQIGMMVWRSQHGPRKAQGEA